MQRVVRNKNCSGGYIAANAEYQDYCDNNIVPSMRLFVLDVWNAACNAIETIFTSPNSAITKFCPHHKRNEQCIWGLRGCCRDTACSVRPELRK